MSPSPDSREVSPEHTEGHPGSQNSYTMHPAWSLEQQQIEVYWHNMMGKAPNKEAEEKISEIKKLGEEIYIANSGDDNTPEMLAEKKKESARLSEKLKQAENELKEMNAERSKDSNMVQLIKTAINDFDKTVPKQDLGVSLTFPKKIKDQLVMQVGLYKLPDTDTQKKMVEFISDKAHERFVVREKNKAADIPPFKWLDGTKDPSAKFKEQKQGTWMSFYQYDKPVTSPLNQMLIDEQNKFIG